MTHRSKEEEKLERERKHAFEAQENVVKRNKSKEWEDVLYCSKAEIV